MERRRLNKDGMLGEVEEGSNPGGRRRRVESW